MSDSDPIHELKNHLGVILGFVELLLADMNDRDPKHGDLVEIKEAAGRAMSLLPRISRSLGQNPQ